jgi:phosphonate transport system substrate-binding protein
LEVWVEVYDLSMAGKPTLQAVSYLAPNWFGFYQTMTDALERSLSIKTQLQQGESDPLEDLFLLQDQLDLAFICGLPFIRHHKANPNQLHVLASPVMNAPRYHNRSIYFSDVVVNATSETYHFSGLAGQAFSYNDPGSNSDYNLVLWHLLKSGYRTDFLGDWVESGSHQRSLEWIMEGRVDWAAIDSTVLEQTFADHPELASQVRVIGWC